MGLRSWALDQLSRAKREFQVLKLIVQDTRTPRISKWMLGFAIAYVAMPFDIIPDFIPILGQLDDLLIVPLLLVLAMKMIPGYVISDCRRRATQQYSQGEGRAESFER